MNKQLKKVIEYANKHSEYYQTLFLNNQIDCNNISELTFNKIPIMTKLDYKLNVKKIIVDEYQYNHINFLNKITTSGSSGIPLTIYFEPREYTISNLILWRLRKKWYGVNPYDKMCAFTSDLAINGIVMDAQDVYIRGNKMFFSKIKISRESISSYFQHIQKFSPNWLYIQPSVMMNLYSYMCEENLKLPDSLTYIELFGENVSYHFLKKLKQYYRNIDIAVMYGAKEFNAIALMCPCGKMHILDNNVFIETNDNNEIIVTGLVNTKVPIIRYNLQDRITLKENFLCKCGIQGSIIEEIIGRSCNIEYIDDNITSDLLKWIIEKVNYLYSECIYEYRLCSVKENKIVVGIYLNNSYLSWKKIISEEIKKYFRSFLSTSKAVEIVILNNCDVSLQSGKFKY